MHDRRASYTGGLFRLYLLYFRVFFLCRRSCLAGTCCGVPCGKNASESDEQSL